ncbi:DUF6274 family protein [Streptomyces sp. NBC_01498]|uniref:DUF6274 family protein n=1 Tax=Streptomyces sp. NBC_01498 TaxID=2975870 RepID=UPI002E7C42F8|nr:DUF6274 family protein [Streptomyces sp. NBC_01498]WTL26033.1 DUF6274 family protein [Streptomyces sp. NBC_01498]
MAASAAKHETRALLRAHLAAATGYRHVTYHCAVCHRLQRLVMDPAAPVPPGAGEATGTVSAPRRAPEADSDPH